MSGQRIPIEVIEARGAKHLTKAEISKRHKAEVKPITDNIIPPSWLTAKQKKEFAKIADQLQKLKIMGETDTEALARYIVAQDLYVKSVKLLRSKAVLSDPEAFAAISKTQDLYCKQCRSLANDLGLTIASRCKLVVPEPVEKPRENKFRRFEKIQ